MASIRSKHNNLLNYFICNHKDLSKAYVRKCTKFLKRIEGWEYSPSPQAGKEKKGGSRPQARTIGHKPQVHVPREKKK
jgi:hypothetical protein